uniref:Uncharacterized protein n=1 Tax=Nelumbo nucifera TaxID=4432 RepID=A0A822ZH12_NELNU|nr:TPA_asm: hypothetical protein HUJ06_001191 [Nelumbo nucifera]
MADSTLEIATCEWVRIQVCWKGGIVPRMMGIVVRYAMCIVTIWLELDLGARPLLSKLRNAKTILREEVIRRYEKGEMNAFANPLQVDDEQIAALLDLWHRVFQNLKC